MIFFSIGLPGAFAEWCDGFALQAVRRAFGATNSIVADNLEDLAIALLETRTANVIVKSRSPVGRLQRAIIDSSIRFVLALPDPREAVENLVTGSGYSLQDAVRAVGTSCASMRSFVDARSALVVEIDHGKTAALETAKAICNHLDIMIQDAEIGQIVDGLDSACFFLAKDMDRSKWWRELTGEQRDLIDGALLPYMSTDSSRALESLVWGRELFFVGDAPTEAATYAVDVTGRVRCLIYGPYILIPSGAWTANVVFACSKELSGMAFMIEILSGPDRLGMARLLPSKAGVFEVAINITVEKSAALPIEIRIFNERAAFDGRLGLGNVTLIQNSRINSGDYRKISEAFGLEF
jgi:hypothetical protein